MPDCACCDGLASISQGFVYDRKAPFAAYVGGVTGLTRSARPLLAIVAGPWREGARAADRNAAVFQGRPGVGARYHFRLTAERPLFWPDFASLGRRLASTDKASVEELRDLAQLIVSRDERLAFLLANGRARPVFAAHATP